MHELKQDGYRLQIHTRDGRVRLYTMNAADWSHRYPIIVEDAARIKGTAIIAAEVVCAGKDGVPDFDRLHGRCFDHLAVACAFDLLMLNGDDLRRRTLAERKPALRKLLKHEPNSIQYVEHIGGDGDAMFECASSALRALSQKSYTPPTAPVPRKAGLKPKTRKPRRR